MAITKSLSAALIAGMLMAVAAPAGAQSFPPSTQNNQNNQKNQQHPAPARPAVVTPKPTTPSPFAKGVTPGTGTSRFPQGTGTASRQGTTTASPAFRRFTGTTPGATTPSGTTPHFAGTTGTTTPGTSGHWTGQGTTASLGTQPGWHGGSGRVFSGSGVHPGPGVTFGAGVVAAGGVAAAGGWVAQPHWHGYIRGGAPAFDAVAAISFAQAHEHDFHVNDVRFFTAQELVIWRHGVWHNGWYNGHWGWWWVVGNVWYPYAAPIYPYPVVVAPLIVGNQIAVPEMPPGAGPPPPPAAEGAPPPMALSSEIPPLPAPPQVTYQCNNPQGAFPDVGACGDAWAAMPLSATAMNQ